MSCQITAVPAKCEAELAAAGVTVLGFEGRRLVYLDCHGQVLAVSRSALRRSRNTVIAVCGADMGRLSRVWPKPSRTYPPDFNARAAAHAIIRCGEQMDIRAASRRAVRLLEEKIGRYQLAIRRLRKFDQSPEEGDGQDQ